MGIVDLTRISIQMSRTCLKELAHPNNNRIRNKTKRITHQTKSWGREPGLLEDLLVCEERRAEVGGAGGLGLPQRRGSGVDTANVLHVMSGTET